MKVSNVSWKIGGKAGSGIMSARLIFSKIFTKKGYFVINCKEYPSVIWGGHNTCTVRISSNEIFSINKNINILIALNEETAKIHQEEVTYGGYTAKQIITEILPHIFIVIRFIKQVNQKYWSKHHHWKTEQNY
jgi:Pyruvate/2-oxoacid:ferredoxin oxidoreductase gamma subunit